MVYTVVQQHGLHRRFDQFAVAFVEAGQQVVEEVHLPEALIDFLQAYGLGAEHLADEEQSALPLEAAVVVRHTPHFKVAWVFGLGQPSRVGPGLLQ